jgi:hypothetical protein
VPFQSVARSSLGRRSFGPIGRELEAGLGQVRARWQIGIANSKPILIYDTCSSHTAHSNVISSKRSNFQCSHHCFRSSLPLWRKLEACISTGLYRSYSHNSVSRYNCTSMSRPTFVDAFVGRLSKWLKDHHALPLEPNQSICCSTSFCIASVTS